MTTADFDPVPSANLMQHPATTFSLLAIYSCLGVAAVLFQTMPAHVVILSVVLAVFLVALSTVDIADGVLPDILTLPLILIGLVSAWWFQFDGFVWRALSAAAGGAVIVAINLAYRRFRGVDGIGYGDAKLFAASGAWLGMIALPSVLLWACASALLVMLARAFWTGGVSGTSALAFGPHLALGTWLVWLFGAIG